MNSEAARKMLFDGFAGMVAGHPEALLKHVTPDFLMIVSEGNPMRGVTEVQSMWDYYLENYEFGFDITNVITEGDMICAECTLMIRYVRDKAGFPPARGKSVVMPVAIFATLKGDKISLARFIYAMEDWMRVFTDDEPMDQAI